MLYPVSLTIVVRGGGNAKAVSTLIKLLQCFLSKEHSTTKLDVNCRQSFPRLDQVIFHSLQCRVRDVHGCSCLTIGRTPSVTVSTIPVFRGK